MDTEMDHFRALEGKIENLINYISSLKEEKDTLEIKNKTLEEKMQTMAGELDLLKQDRNEAKSRIMALLEKIENLNV